MSEMDRTDKAVEKIAELGRVAAGAQWIKRGTMGAGYPVLAVPPGWDLKSPVGLMPSSPERIDTTVSVVDVKSFIAYVNEHKRSHSRIFANALKAPFGLTCALDYHGQNTVEDKARPSFVTHMCQLNFTMTDAWREWDEHNRKPMAQDAFALFVEERQIDVIEPTGADLLELARSIEATQSASFKRKIRLDNGDTQFAFEDNTTATAGLNGRLTIPENLVLKFALFLGMPEQAVECRFRHRLDSGKLTLSYEIVRRQELLLKTIQAAIDIVAEETGLAVFMGTFAVNQ